MSALPYSETEIFNKVRQILQASELEVLQLVPPGGQAPFSLTYLDEELGRKRTVYPDLIARNDNYVFVGEMKPRYSREDLIKLTSISASDQAINDIIRLSHAPPSVNFLFALIHSQSGPPNTGDIYQIVFSESGCVVHQNEDEIEAVDPFLNILNNLTSN